MARFILKTIDEQPDKYSADVTYEFNMVNGHLSDFLYHLAAFTRSVGYTYVTDLVAGTESGGQFRSNADSDFDYVLDDGDRIKVTGVD